MPYIISKPRREAELNALVQTESGKKYVLQTYKSYKGLGLATAVAADVTLGAMIAEIMHHEYEKQGP